MPTAATATPSVAVQTRTRWRPYLRLILRLLIGALVAGGTTWIPALRHNGLQALGPMLAIGLIVCSLFGELPFWASWTQRLGAWLFPGIAVATIVLLLPWLIPAGGVDSSLVAFSPAVWGAYLSIVLVGLSFEASDLPQRIYRLCQASGASPWILVPAYVAIAGLLGNILDGVSIMAISVVVLLSLLPLRWAIRSSFALLLGGLIANLITVAAEPTNIKFQDVLHGVLDGVTPAYWFSNWPISLFGMLVPTIWLAIWMRRDSVSWRQDEPDASRVFGQTDGGASSRQTILLGATALLLLAAGIIVHSVIQSVSRVSEQWPLWLLLLPAGVCAVLHLWSSHGVPQAIAHIRTEWPVWGKLMIIFSLLWFVANAMREPTSALSVFFTWPEQVRYGALVVLSLLSAITDNVAVAAMQGTILLHHPLPTWQIRLLFILLTWAGGFTSFGCLQGLAVHSRLKLTGSAWFREALPWGLLAIGGGVAGLLLINVLYPTAVALPQ
jgi:hypothetical protein